MIVCPYCGMSTWIDDHCALPGCEGSGADTEGFWRDVDRELIQAKLEQGQWETIFEPDDGP